MVEAFDRIVVAVQDLDRALAQYQVLLGATAWRSGAGLAWLGLPNTVIQLAEVPDGVPAIRGLVLNAPGAGVGAHPEPNPLQLDLSLCDGSETGRFRCAQPEAQSPHLSVDHLVLRTGNSAACIDLFADRLGIRLALDRTVPEWGGRMLFFRAGKLTLEVIESDSEPVLTDYFWGIAYRCADIESEATRLKGAGVALSEIREGRKRDTKVATVKSHCLGIPTLLIAPT